MKIDSFTGGFKDFSNFEPALIRYRGYDFPTVEHAYQAAKAINQADFDAIRNALTPGAAKKLGRKIQIRPDWEEMKIPLMMNFLRQKFQYGARRDLLVSTNNHELIEGNTWGDKYWGQVDGKGENWLGRCLMHIRTELQTFGNIIAGEIE